MNRTKRSKASNTTPLVTRRARRPLPLGKGLKRRLTTSVISVPLLEDIQTFVRVSATIGKVWLTTAGRTAVTLASDSFPAAGDMCWINGDLVYLTNNEFYFDLIADVAIGQLVELRFAKSISEAPPPTSQWQ